LNTDENRTVLGRDEGAGAKTGGVEDLQTDVIVRKLTSIMMEYLFEHADKSLVDTHSNILKDIKGLDNYKKKFGILLGF
jgi:hypothetical protein